MIPADTPSRPSIGVFTRAKNFFTGTMLLASYGFGIRLKPRMDKGNFILRPTFSLALLARVSAPGGGNMQRWRFLVIRDAKVKETVGAYYKRAWDEPGTISTAPAAARHPLEIGWVYLHRSWMMQHRLRNTGVRLGFRRILMG
jgi:hypothetical protein